MNQPTRLDEFTLLSPLGIGGMGELWIAKQDGSSSLCVVKTLRLIEDEATHAHNNREARLQREGMIGQVVRHPNVARTIKTGRAGDTFYLAMELIDGLALGRLLDTLVERHERLPVHLASAIAVQALAALEAIHGALGDGGQALGLVHRDLTPANIMVGFDGVVRVIDFGVARADLGSFRTATGMVPGTPRYASPEQAEAREIDSRSDLYALAVVHFEMFTGVPFIGARDLVGQLYEVLEKAPPSDTSFPLDVPTAVGQVIIRNLSKDRNERLDSARATRMALTAAGVQPEVSRLGDFMRETFPDQVTVVSTLAPPEDDTTIQKDRVRVHVAQPRGAIALFVFVLVVAVAGRFAMRANDVEAIQVPIEASRETAPADPAQPTIASRPGETLARRIESATVSASETAVKIAVPSHQRKARARSPDVAPPSDALAEKLAQLKSRPGNAELFAEVYQEIERRARGVSGARQARVREELNAASVMGDSAALERAARYLVAD